MGTLIDKIQYELHTQQIANKMKLCLILIGLLAFSVCSIQAQEEDVVVAEDLVAEEPAEIDGEIDSESDENSSSSSEEDDDDDDDDNDDEDTDGDGLVDDVDPDDDNDGILDDVDDDDDNDGILDVDEEDDDLEDIEVVATTELCILKQGGVAI